MSAGNSDTNGRQILYPAIPSVETYSQNIKELSKARINEMLNQKATMEKTIKHLKKIKTRWGRIDVGIKVSGVILAASGAVAGVIVGTISGPLLIPIFVPSLPIIVGSLTAAETLITGGLVIGLTSKRKAYYREKIRIVQSYIDRMYLYIEKARSDNIITIEELEGFRRLMVEYENAMNGIKIDNFDFDKLNKDIKKEIRKELIQEKKEELRAKLLGQRP